MIRLPQGVKIENMPLDDMYSSALRGLLSRINRLYQAIYGRYGEDGLELTQKVSSEYGNDIARKVSKSNDHWDIQKVGLHLIKIFNNMRSDGEVIEFTDKCVSTMVRRCPYRFEKKICSAHVSMEQALVKGLNPTLDYHIAYSIPGGDPFCLHVLINSDDIMPDSLS